MFGQFNVNATLALETLLACYSQKLTEKQNKPHSVTVTACWFVVVGLTVTQPEFVSIGYIKQYHHNSLQKK